MNFIKYDQYDQMYFTYLEQKYDLVRSLQKSRIKIINKDMLFDLYNILFKEQFEIKTVKKEEVPRNDFIRYLLINNIIESNYLARIKRYTVLNEQNSFLFIAKLLDSFGAYSIWEDEDDDENTDALLASAEQLDENPDHDHNKGRGLSQASKLSPQVSEKVENITDKLVEYIENAGTILQNYKQMDFIPVPDKMKQINTIYNLNRVMDGMEKIKKVLTEKNSVDLKKAEKTLQKYRDWSANKIIIEEMEKYLQQVGLQVEKEVQKKQEIYESLKKLSSHSYWDLTLGNLVQSNPEFCFYLSRLIKNHPEILKISRLMGNLKVIRSRKHKRMTNSTYECKMNISTSNDITNLIPLELLYLDQQLEKIFYDKLIEQKLFTYDYKSRSSKGKGGIIVCLDTSGSMIGTKLDLIKAIVLNLALRTLQKKRYFALINFSSSMKDILLLPHRPDFKGFIDLLISSFYGGTNFTPPMKRTLEILENFRRHRESDVLIFSDGFGRLSEKVIEQLNLSKKKYRFGLFGFLIDDASEDTALANCCDRIFYLTSNSLLKDLLDYLGKLA